MPTIKRLRSGTWQHYRRRLLVRKNYRQVYAKITVRVTPANTDAACASGLLLLSGIALLGKGHTGVTFLRATPYPGQHAQTNVRTTTGARLSTGEPTSKGTTRSMFVTSAVFITSPGTSADQMNSMTARSTETRQGETSACSAIAPPLRLRLLPVVWQFGSPRVGLPISVQTFVRQDAVLPVNSSSMTRRALNKPPVLARTHIRSSREMRFWALA
mmetsp:Transcript_22941/g.52995  ORF Transcript_22941/g.52995 Transcript_22941/m.52995 type:complete len:215 (+) Transcript_22941:554-1198(+)